MMKQYRKTPRARFLDYDFGDYFITICTKDKKHYFGEIVDSEMRRTAIGDFVNQQLEKCSEYCPAISIPVFVVMPNHIHFIIALSRETATNVFEQRTPNAALRGNPKCQRHVTTLSTYITSLKGAVTKHAKALGIEFGWQTRYHDHMIRGFRDGNNISDYISDNVAKWQEDCFNKE